MSYSLLQAGRRGSIDLPAPQHYELSTEQYTPRTSSAADSQPSKDSSWNQVEKETGWSKPILADESGRGAPYDRGSRWLALTGLILTFIAGLVFIVLGVLVAIIAAGYHYTSQDLLKRSFGTSGSGPEGWMELLDSNSSVGISAIALLLNGAVTILTEATGYVHGTTLKWALVKQGHLPFNANLRLFTTAGRWNSPNGLLVNIVFVVTLIMSYAASSSVILQGRAPFKIIPDPKASYVAVVSILPPVFIGAAFIIQALLGFLAFRKTEVLTWSTNPLDVAAAHFYHNLLSHQPGRCMRSAADASDPSTAPVTPSALQPSALTSHRLVRSIVRTVWIIPAGIILIAILFLGTGGGQYIRWAGVAPLTGVLWGSLLIGTLQSILTIGLHCCELVVTLSRDEATWRAATSHKGSRPSSNPLWTVLGNWQSVGLLIAKPVIHWLFGQSIAMQIEEGVSFEPHGMLLLSAGWVVLAGFITFVAWKKPKGPQPATYGHLQTLVNLVDEWSVTTVLYWGHKQDDGTVAHAGTSDRPLEPIVMSLPYAGDIL